MQSIVPHLRCACRARSYRREAPFKKEARGPRLWLSEIYTPRLRCACRPRSYRREAPFKKEARGPHLRFSAIPMPHLRWGAGARWAQSSADRAGRRDSRARSYRREAPFKKEARGPRLRFSAIPMPHLRWGAGARWAQSSAFSAAASVGASPQPAGETAAHAPIAAEAVPGSQLAARANTISNLLYHTCGGMTNTIFLFQPSPVCYEKNPRPTKARGAGIIL